MKVKVIERYRDLEMGEIEEPGNTFEVSKDRAETLIQKGFVEGVKENKAKREGPFEK